MKEFILTSTGSPAKSKINYENELNPEQLQVVQNGDGPCLVLAGAGSGKTRTITYRVAWLLENGVQPQDILLLTFTNKAAKEMVSRVEALLGQYPQGLWGGTFHSIANRILRQYGQKLGYSPNFSILDQEDSNELVGMCVKDLKIDTKDKRFPSSRVLHGIISFRSNKDCSLEHALEIKHPKFVPLKDEIREVADLYHRQKLQQNSMDFDDLLLRLLDLLRDHPDVRERLASQFKYVLVDEFQDTNVIQAEIVHKLSSNHKNLLVVGDDAQSIYSFRAAEVRNILDFPSKFEGAKTFQLTTNYRSTPQILDVANSVIAQNKDQFKKSLRAVVKAGEQPNLVPAANQAQEAQYIADQIVELVGDGSSFCDIAVLFRAAFHSQALEFELMRRDIPYKYRGGLKFFERAHVKDVVSHLRLIQNPRDVMAWMRVLKIHPGIGAVTAAKIGKACANIETVDDVLTLDIGVGAKARCGWDGFLRVLSSLLKGKRVPSYFIRALASNDDYQLYLEHTHPNHHERLEDLEQFAVFAEQYGDLGEFLEAVSLTSEYGAEKGRADFEDRLILSTIHQAKGLEWDHVFVMHLAEGCFPHSRAYSEKGGIEEERRLFYVATTRAKQKLYLTYPMTAGHDTLEIKEPSQFLEEIPEGKYEMVKLKHGVASGWGSGSNSMGRKGGGLRSDLFWGDNDDEPAIVLDDLGERVKKTMPTSFLRDIDDL
ncbi:MAG: ATP-dependent helicase [Candidatus Uhrbacteria bacterium]|nr:ATP-dependent helicase [Candidatus Uhrbacteria bacterium]